MRILKLISKYLLAVFFIVGGLNHFLNPPFYLKIMPPYLPWHLFLVYLSGIFEIAFGILLMVARYSRYGAWGIIALLIAVFPANIHRNCGWKPPILIGGGKPLVPFSDM